MFLLVKIEVLSMFSGLFMSDKSHIQRHLKKRISDTDDRKYV